MSQEITVTNVEDHYEMQFGGGDAYPVPTNAIDKLDDDLTPEDVGESVTFRGDYGGHKHCKSFDVEEVIETPGDDEDDEDNQEENDDEMVHAEVPDAVPYNSRTAGIAQQINAQRLFSDGGGADVEAPGEQQPSQETDDSDSDGESEHLFASDDSECRHVDCSETPDMAAECDTGQTKYYCEEHAGGRRAGHALVEEWRGL